MIGRGGRRLVRTRGAGRIDERRGIVLEVDRGGEEGQSRYLAKRIALAIDGRKIAAERDAPRIAQPRY